MHQLFLTALIEESEFPAACAVLSGYCAMPPWESVNRVLYFQGPPRPAGISNQASIDKPMRKDTAFLWRDLHQNLARQSFVLQARYDVSKERDMGPAAAAMDLDASPGILRWTDFPEPAHARPLLTQRKIVELWEQKRLPSIMRDNHYQCVAPYFGDLHSDPARFKTETVEELLRFYRDDTEFCLTRHYFVRPINHYFPLESEEHQSSGPLSTLPAWDALTAVDMQSRWILQVKAHVIHDSKPDEIRKAQDQLMSIRNEFEGIFDFRAIDRKVHDTRVAMQQQGVQALPQKVILGT